MKKRLKKVQQALPQHQIDALLVRVWEGDSPNVRYLSGFGGTTAVLLITADKGYIITDPRYYARAVEEAPDFELVKQERGKSVSEYVNQILADSKLADNARVGFEANHITVEVAEQWSRELQFQLQPVYHLVERFRQFKDDEEIEKLRKACRKTSKVFKEVVELIETGMTEREVALELDMRLLKHGALKSSFDAIIGSGPNSAIPHHATGDRKLKAGEPVVMDFGGLFPGGYCSDITRTVFVPGKKPDKKMVEIYKIVLEANQAAFGAMKPGMKWSEYDKVARDVIAERGYGQYFTHGLGHSLGLLVHDPYDYANDEFEVGLVITDEPGIYIEGLGGVRIEDDVVLTDNGPERLTNAPYWKF